MSKQTERLIAIDEEYSSLKSALSKKQDKALQDIIAQERIKEYSVLGRGMNMADKATSLAVRGNTDIVIESPNEKELYITLGKEMLKNETRDKKSKGGKADFPDLTGDGKVTRADVLKGRGVELRDQKSLGGLAKLASKGIKSLISELSPQVRKTNKNKVDDIEIELEQLERAYTDTFLPEGLNKANEKTLEKSREEIIARMNRLSLQLEDLSNPRVQKQTGGDVDTQMEMMLGGVEEINAPMVPDEQMEEDYVDYVVQETLSNQDRNYLIDALEKDDRLSEIFDQVVESATEFTGSGTVEGPGTGRSDSIPARLSDGEFVFTAKATEEIGADNLMSMMKEAEREADERLQAQEGGLIEEEETVTMPVEKQPVEQDIRVTKETVGSQAAMQEQSDLVDEELKKSMLSTRPYVRS
jgi:hypothetical protein